MNNLEEKNESVEMTLQTLLKILNYSSDEIFVLDGNKRILYVNRTCEKHYGLKPSDVIGNYSMDLFEKGYWTPTIVPEVYEKKEPCYMKQQTYIGAELTTSAIPILNDKREIELVVITSTETQTYKMLEAKKEGAEASSTQLLKEKSKMITNSSKIIKILSFCKKVAPTESTILILGESGTGKGVLAQFIHGISNRKDKPFIKINCAAIPEELLESELFGYTKGAFTGANQSGKQGLIEAADGGTIFLDEIGEIPMSVQAKLLQVIQEKQFIPVGSNEIKKVDIRIITATNRDLLEMVQAKQFREDLFYRLNVIDILLPPLRERRGDIIPLAYSFLNKFNEKYNENKMISEECLNLFMNYLWPGNVRQLENLIERLVVVSDSIIQVSDLPEIIKEKAEHYTTHTNSTKLNEVLEETTRMLVRKSYQNYGSTRKVATDLGISQTKASKLCREYCKDLISKPAP